MRSSDLVIQTEHLSQTASQWLSERVRLVHCAVDDPQFQSHLAQAAGLVVRTYTIVNEQLLKAAPHLRVVGRAGVGLDNIDLRACKARNVQVVYTPDANTQAVAEFVFAILGDLLRPRLRLDHAVSPDQWNTIRNQYVGQRQMNQMTLGVLGMGRVGQRVSAIASAIGMRVIYNDLIEVPAHQRQGAEPVDVKTLFAASDVLSIHVDGRRSNHHFVTASLLGLLKPDAVLINTSRGFVVDNLALAEWLRRHPNAAALLDVHEPEPFGPDYPLLNMPNAILYPHLASRTETAMNNMSWVVKDVLAVLQGEKPLFPAPL